MNNNSAGYKFFSDTLSSSHCQMLQIYSTLWRLKYRHNYLISSLCRWFLNSYHLHTYESFLKSVSWRNNARHVEQKLCSAKRAGMLLLVPLQVLSLRRAENCMMFLFWNEKDLCYWLGQQQIFPLSLLGLCSLWITEPFHAVP